MSEETDHGDGAESKSGIGTFDGESSAVRYGPFAVALAIGAAVYLLVPAPPAERAVAAVAVVPGMFMLGYGACRRLFGASEYDSTPRRE